MAPVVDSYSSTLTPDLVARLITAIVLGYSGRWNARRLENPFHAFWNTVFAEWIADLHPYAVLIPQYQIDTIQQTLGPDDSMGTITRDGAKELTPDFVIVIAHLISRTTTSPLLPTFPPHFSSWRDIKLSELKPSFLAELKRPPPRSLVSQEAFLGKLFASFARARKQLMDQSEHVFIKYPYMGDLIVIACVGEWWSWRIVAQAHFQMTFGKIVDGSTLPFFDGLTLGNARPSPTDNIPLASSSRSAQMEPPAPATPTTPPPADSRETRRRSGKNRSSSQESLSPLGPKHRVPWKGNTHSGRRRTPAEKEAAEREKRERARIQDFHRHENLPANKVEQPGGDEESILERLRTKWSAYLLFGTDASNEHLSIIHRVLERQMPQVPTHSHTSQSLAMAEREPTDDESEYGSEMEVEGNLYAEDELDDTDLEDGYNNGGRDMDMSF